MLVRVSPGIYRDEKTGKTVRAKTLADAQKAMGRTGKKTGGGSTVAQTPEQRQQEAVNNLLGPAAEGASGLANLSYAPGSLGRIDETLPPEVQEYLAKQKAMSEFYGAGGQQRSADMQEYMARQKAGLEGYDAPEMTAMREQAGRQNDAAYANQRALAMQNQARSGVRGASGNAQLLSLARAKAGQDSQLNQDLMVKNADEKQRRLSAYGTSLGNLENTEFDRARNTLSDYGTELGATRNDVFERQKLNLGQTEKEKAGYAGVLFGGLDLANQNKAADRNFNLQKRLIALAKRRASGGGTTPDYSGYASANLAQYGE